MAVHKCRWCSKEFVSLTLLTAHYNKCPSKPKVQPNPVKPKRATCPKCGKWFASQHHVNQHKGTCKGTKSRGR